MKYDVRLTRKAERQLNDAVDWWAQRLSVEQAERWHAGIVQAMMSLASNPQRCRLARENRSVPIDIRELPFGLGRVPSHRVIFTIRPESVIVYAIRHLAQDDITADDL